MGSFIKPCGTPVVTGCTVEVNAMTDAVTITLPVGVPSIMARLLLMQLTSTCESCDDSFPPEVEIEEGYINLKVTGPIVFKSLPGVPWPGEGNDG